MAQRKVNVALKNVGPRVTKTGWDELDATDLPDTAVTPGSYTSANITVDAQGRITAASNGSGGGGSGTVTSVDVSGGTTGLTTTGGPVTSTGTITLAGTLALANGGTGQTTRLAAMNALLPTQTGFSGRALVTDGTTHSWGFTSNLVDTMGSVSGDTIISHLAVNTTDVTLAGQNYLSRTGQVITANSVDLSGSNASGTLAAGRFPALTGDITTTAGSLATTLRNAVALSVLGRSANSTGVLADIAAGTDGHILRRSGTSLGFGTIPMASVNMNTARLLGRTTASAGATEEISVTAPLLLSAGALSAPAFVAAGGSHAAGIVPDPGATAHSNDIYFLRDTGSFGKMPGQWLGSSTVDTDQSTTATTPTDLASIESVTFTLDAAADVLVIWRANTYAAGGATAAFGYANYDGTDDVNSVSICTLASGNSFETVIHHKKNLAAGSHTVKIRKWVSVNSGNWRNRCLTVFRLN